MARKIFKYPCKSCGQKFNISYSKIRKQKDIACPSCKTLAEYSMIFDMQVLQGISDKKIKKW